MIEATLIVVLIDINLNESLKDFFLRKKISEEYLKFLTIICNCETKEFKPWNIEPHIIRLSFQTNLFDEEILDADRNSIPRNDITEYAAVGHIFCYLFRIRPKITNLEVLNPPNAGYDFICEENNSLIKIEISGVNSDRTQEFASRISEKRNKFRNNQFNIPPVKERLIGVVDFTYLRYTFWDIFRHLNYKRRRSN